jgi:hypothetical protein
VLPNIIPFQGNIPNYFTDLKKILVLEMDENSAWPSGKGNNGIIIKNLYETAEALLESALYNGTWATSNITYDTKLSFCYFQNYMFNDEEWQILKTYTTASKRCIADRWSR